MTRTPRFPVLLSLAFLFFALLPYRVPAQEASTDGTEAAAESAAVAPDADNGEGGTNATASGTGEGDTPGATETLPPGLNPDAALLARMSGLFIAEDPTSVYQLEVYDENVEFILDGDWTAGFDGSLDFTFDDGVTTLSVTPPVFVQAVNLSAWIFIANRWYFEANFAEEFTKNTLAFGYVGAEGEAVRHARVGNSGIVFPSVYPFIQVGGADRESGSPVIAPGAMGTFGGERWRADAMVRYDAAVSREMILSGMNEASDVTVSIGSPMRGLWFALPKAPVSGAVTVWVESASGTLKDADGRKWRKLNEAEYRVDGLSGVLTLESAASGGVAIAYYDADGTALDDFVNGTQAWFASTIGLPSSVLPTGFLADPDEFRVTISGDPAVLLAAKGRFSPFEILSRYGITGDDVTATHPESGVTEDGLATAAYGDTATELANPGLLDEGGPRDPAARYPLADRFPGIYLPPFTLGANVTDLVLRSRTYSPVSEITLGDQVIPGTIVMTRNGVNDTGFSFNPNTGILTPDRVPGITDAIRITWLDQDTSARNAALTAAAGAAFDPIPGLTLSAGSALRWNVSNSGYTDESEGSPGSWTTSAGVAWKGANLSLSTATAFTLTVPDTTGLYRVAGMDFSSSVLAPAETWYAEVPSTAGVTLGAPEYDSGSEISLAAADDRTDLSVAAVTGIAGSVLELSGDFAAAGEWAGTNILVGELGGVDLRNAATITLTVKNAGSSDSFDLYLQAGAADTGFSEEAGAVATWLLDTPLAGAGWTKEKVTLTEEARRLMGGWQNLRLVIVPTVASTSVSLQSGPITILDAGFSVSADPDFGSDGGVVTVGSGEAVAVTSGSAVQALDSHSGDIVNRLNAGTENSVLVITFAPDEDGGGAISQTITVTRYLSSVPLDAYKKIAFELEVDELPAAGDILVSLLAPAADGSDTVAWQATIPAASLPAGSWRTIEASLPSGSLTADGSKITGATVSSNSRAGLPTKLAVSFRDWSAASTASANEWVVRLDELRLLDTDPVRSVTNESSFAWSRQGRLLGAGKATLLGDPSLSVTGVTNRNLETDATSVSGTADAGLSLVGIRADGSVTASSEFAPVLQSTSHTVTVPLGPIGLSENLSADFENTALSRAETVSLSGPLPVNARGTLSLGPRVLTRGDSLSVTPAIPLGPAGSLALSADGKATQNGESPWPELEGMAWGDMWGDSLVLMGSMGEADATRRGLDSRLAATWNAPGGESPTRWGIVSVTGGLNLAETYALGASSTATRLSSTGYDFYAPFRAAGSLFTPSWKRSVTRLRQADTGGSWNADALALGDSFRKAPWLREAPPVSDLFAPAPAGEEDPESAFTFLTTYSLNWNRPAPGAFSDLWTPVSANATVSRESLAETLAASARDTRSASLRANFSAFNLAGAWGAKPIFKWYEQDEVAQSYGWGAKWGAGYFTWNMDAWDGITVYYGETGSLSLDNAVAYTSPGVDGTGESLGGTVRAAWVRETDVSPIEPLVARFTKLEVGARREDSLSWIWKSLETPSATVEYAHALITKIGENGEIKMSGGVTYAAAEESETTLGIRLSVGGTLRY